MAFKKKLKLNSFSVSYHTSEDVQTKIFKRGYPTDTLDLHDNSGNAATGSGEPQPLSDDEYEINTCSTPWDLLPKDHAIQSQNTVEGWNKARMMLRNTLLETNAMPPNQMCVLCCNSSALYRCTRCGPFAYYCEECLQNVHVSACVLHTPEEWKVHV